VKANLHKDIHSDGAMMSAIFLTRVAEGLDRYSHRITQWWHTDTDNLDLPGGTCSASYSGDERYEQRIVEMPDGLVLLLRHQRLLTVQAASSSQAAVLDLMADVKEAIPEGEVDEDVVRIKFWYHTQNGPAFVDRKIGVSEWASIRDNYTESVQTTMDQLVSPEFEPGRGGQLILWEGEPGTGKTHALRALARSWKKWASINFVTDPENFFGNSSYMTNVLTMWDNDDDKWNVLILEDAGELLSRDAKERTGQAVSRLLNLVDGLIGQGLKILVVVTTNEPVKGFHEAIARPGRCAVHIPFERLEHEEVGEWLASHDIDPEEAFPGMTIADLYGLLNHTEGAKQQKRSFGFSS
jgi:hypothetical protein